MNKLTRKQKKMAKKIALGALLYGIALFSPHYLSLVCFLAAYLILASNILRKSFNNIQNGQLFDENFLMSIASVGAIVLGEFSEAVAVVLFYQIGEWFQSYAVHQSRQSIASLMDIRPEEANLKVGNKIEVVDPNQVRIGDTIVVSPSERIPLDGIISKGSSALDVSSLTGESMPKDVQMNDTVMSGSINQTGVLEIKVTSTFENSTVSKILELVENASNKKSHSEQFITRFARYYTPIVVFCALALAVIPSMFLGNWNVWVYRALTFLVISCPCALVISVPLSFFGGIGSCSRHGILVKGSSDLENLSKVETMVFDKTGTLTEGKFKVVHVESKKYSSSELLALAAYVESFSHHPIALSIVEAYGKEIDQSIMRNVSEFSGKGIQAQIENHKIWVGKSKDKEVNSVNTCVYVYIDEQWVGYIELADVIKEDSYLSLQDLRKDGIKKMVMLTGDQKEVAESIGEKLGLDEIHPELLPQDKVTEFEKVASHASSLTAFVGDGMNDAPVLMRADVGIAMGGLGSDAAIEASDLVLMQDSLSQIVQAMKISRKTLQIVYENIAFAIGVKVLVLILGAFGFANMWMAVFADVGVAMLAILNAMRTLKI